MSVAYNDEQTITFAKELVLSYSNAEDAPIVEMMFQGSNRDVWITAFTHKYKDPEHNFERLESLGDAVLKTYFRKFIYQHYPQYDESDITNLQAVYMATDEQRNIANILELTKFMRLGKFVGNPDPGKILMLQEQAGADILESFFGAISDTADSIGAEVDGDGNTGRIINGIGEIICTNFIYKIFSGDHPIITIKDEDRFGNINTIVIQMMEKLGIPYIEGGVSGKKGKTIFHETQGKKGIILSLDEDQLRVLNQKISKITGDDDPFDKFEGRGAGVDKRTSLTNAYQHIYNQLFNKGISRESVSLFTNRERSAKMVGERVFKKLKLDFLTVEEDSKTKITTFQGKERITEGVYQLVGHREKKPPIILCTALLPTNTMNKDNSLKTMVDLYVEEITPRK